MMRSALMLFLLAIAIPAEAGWNSLWLNPDQRGEALLQQGDANAAAREYKDPRRRAYAEMKAGDFKQAASDLGNLHDSDSYYNRGNALAKMGDLKGALDAYDAALKSDPNNQDARHNRDLVENALKQKSSQQNSGQQKSGSNQQQDSQKKDDKSGNKQGSTSEGQGKQSSPSGNSANGANNQTGNQSQSAEKNSSQPAKSGGNPAGKNSAAQQNAQAGASGNQAQQNPQKNPGQQGSDANAASGQSQNGATATNQQAAKPGNPSGNGQSADEAAQARQDAAASLEANKPGTTGNQIANAAPADQTAPLSEQQLSREQWLRSIPDDPGGLLRRKFMIEYMLRQQKAQQ